MGTLERERERKREIEREREVVAPLLEMIVLRELRSCNMRLFIYVSTVYSMHPPKRVGVNKGIVMLAKNKQS